MNGRVSALLELGSGFNPEFSGRDNVYLNGAILGFSNKEMDRRFAEIEEFAEIGDFINQPVKTYSSGMVVRLAFAVAINVDPEILLVDEALAVGDIYFRQRCMRKVHELRARGITILFVSHATGDVKAIGDRALWLEHGRGSCHRQGGSRRYAISCGHGREGRPIPGDRHATSIRNTPIGAPEEIADHIPNIDHRFGDSRAEILGIAIHDAAGVKIQTLQPNTTIVVRISFRAKANLDHPIVGFMFRNHLGVDFAGTNTAREGHQLPAMAAGDFCTVDFHLELPALYPSTFSFSPAIANGTLEHYAICDWIDNAVALHMDPSEGPIYGQFHFPCSVEVNSRMGAGVPTL